MTSTGDLDGVSDDQEEMSGDDEGSEVKEGIMVRGVTERQWWWLTISFGVYRINIRRCTV